LAGHAGLAPRRLKDAALSGKYKLEIRIKTDSDLMHLKAYQIDGKVLRTGSANFSASGLKRQDNDLIILRNEETAARFKANFERIFAAGEKLK
jgi:phosphatidylserine/phosphatidylglycerophosphate/cardiolipin synthase-like enzyme